MLKNIVESKLSSNLTFIIDEENVCGEDLFRAFLIHCTTVEPSQQVHLFCLENPPKLYENCLSWNKQIVFHDFFRDPCSWDGNNQPDLKNYLEILSKKFPKSVFCIDSLYYLIGKIGFSIAYKFLHEKRLSINFICLVHENLFKVDVLEKMLFLATICIYVKCPPEPFLKSNKSQKKLVNIIYKKPNGKISVQTEIFRISGNYKVSSEIINNSSKFKTNSSVTKNEFRDLTTFELGLHMKDTEKKAKEQLVLPYTRIQQHETQEKQNKIIYNLELIDLEDDPDDDLDI